MLRRAKKASAQKAHKQGALQLVAYFAVKGLAYEQRIRLAKRRRLFTGRDTPSLGDLEKKFVALLKNSDYTQLARLLVEAGLIENAA